MYKNIIKTCIDLVDDSIIDEKNQKVVLKFKDGTVKVSEAENGGIFNPEHGILLCTAKFLFEKLNLGSVHSYVNQCMNLDKNNRSRLAARKKQEKQASTTKHRSSRDKVQPVDRFDFDQMNEKELDDAIEMLLLSIVKGLGLA